MSRHDRVNGFSRLFAWPCAWLSCHHDACLASNPGGLLQYTNFYHATQVFSGDVEIFPNNVLITRARLPSQSITNTLERVGVLTKWT
ncbi:hypothetical protein P692DRAFT_20572870 [Suillus brevipes Sb2]|nr:hypothetical protein P692DRAFT_20572870 [Suillus brevipes Sb2]